MSSPRKFMASDVTVAIPTYGRDQVLLNTIMACLNEPDPPAAVIVVDQSPQHDPETEQALTQLQRDGKIIWDRTEQPSQPAAMNRALKLVTTSLILFLDDDIEPASGFVAAHAQGFDDESIWIVVGQIIQPWQAPEDLPAPGVNDSIRRDFDFPFHSSRTIYDIYNVMSGHMTVRVDRALQVGGFDENFKGAAYRFDTEFGRRIIRAGGRVKFEPAASIKHLRVARGGTRTQGDHLASASPNHGQGDYYFAMLVGTRGEAFRYCVRRFFREVRTKFHLKHPWYIPLKFIGEARAVVWAWQLSRQGQSLMPASDTVVSKRNH